MIRVELCDVKNALILLHVCGVRALGNEDAYGAPIARTPHLTIRIQRMNKYEKKCFPFLRRCKRIDKRKCQFERKRLRARHWQQLNTGNSK